MSKDCAILSDIVAMNQESGRGRRETKASLGGLVHEIDRVRLANLIDEQAVSFIRCVVVHDAPGVTNTRSPAKERQEDIQDRREGPEAAEDCQGGADENKKSPHDELRISGAFGAV